MSETWMPDWYEEHIEEGIRDVVRMLRDRGFNTESSCHHDMSIQIQHLVGALCFQELHQFLWNHLSERKEPISFKIEMTHEVREGTVRGCSSVIVTLTGREKVPREKRT